MAGVLNDWICGCGHTMRNIVLPSGQAPEHCGSPMLTCWDHGHPPATDVHEPVYSHATGEYHSSTRDTEMRLAQQAREWSDKNGMRWEPPTQAGDTVRGGRYESAEKGTLASYAGQGSKRSRGGSKRGKGKPASAPAPDPSQYEVNGVTPRRMTATEASEDRKGQIHTGA